MISIIMPAYNSEKYIGKAIDSVLKQTYSDYELIVIDDCSTDNTYKIIQTKAKEDMRIHIYQNTENVGVSKTRNRAVSLANGEWIAFLDSDDIWTEDKLEKQAAFINRNPDTVLFYTGSAFTDEYCNKYNYVLSVCERIDYKTLLRKNLISCSSVVIRRDVIENEKMQGDEMHEDYVTWLNVIKKYGYALGINEPLLIYRLSPNSKSSNRLQSAKMSLNSYHCLGYSYIVSAFFVLRYAFYSIRKRRNIKRSKDSNFISVEPSNKNSYSDIKQLSLCATCKTGSDMLKLDEKEPMCPYIGFHNGIECTKYVAATHKANS